MRHNQAKKRGFMAHKLDMSKAYDRIEWDYVACILIKMGFSALWIDRVMRCVTLVRYSFLVNGEASEVLVPHRGLRQRDPLSSYLFLLCAEGLGGLIRRAYQDKAIHGISIARRAPTITHLLFVDDCMIFARASVQEAWTIMGILKDYEHLWGQMVNLEKYEVSYSKSLAFDIKQRVTATLGFKAVSSHDKYLGLPTFFNRSKKLSFAHIKYRIWKKLQG